jgi:hypothetical protein
MVIEFEHTKRTRVSFQSDFIHSYIQKEFITEEMYDSIIDFGYCRTFISQNCCILNGPYYFENDQSLTMYYFFGNNFFRGFGAMC